LRKQGQPESLSPPESWRLLGGLVTYQHSFAGGNGRPVQNNLQAQPFVIYNLPQGFYLRSTATWNFDLERGNYYIPIGLGAGKIWNLPDGTTINLLASRNTRWLIIRPRRSGNSLWGLICSFRSNADLYSPSALYVLALEMSGISSDSLQGSSSLPREA
jgi:hypothetical protein